MVREKAKLLGKKVNVPCGPFPNTFTVECIIADVREVYGNVQILVTPVSGMGGMWKNLEGLEVLS